MTLFRTTTLAPLLALLLASCVTSSYQVPMSTDGFGLQFVPVTVNRVPGVFLVNTGASHTVIDLAFARRSLGQLGPSDLRLAWLGSKNAETKTGVIEELTIGHFRQRGPVQTHVLNLDAINMAPTRQRTLRIDGILGADFFIEHQAVIDYRTRELSFQALPQNGP